MIPTITDEFGEVKVGVFLRTPYNYDTDEVSKETALVNNPDEVPVTQQQFKEETDIREIVRKFGLTGRLPENLQIPQSGDFTEVEDFQSAMNAVRAGEEAFAQVPAPIRERFANDPGKFLAFVYDEKNRDEAMKMGLLKKPPEETRDAVKAIDDLAVLLKPKP